MNNFLRGKDIVLASNSPRRRELMSFLCEDFRVVPSNAEEIIPDNVRRNFSDNALETAVYLAEIKACDVFENNRNSVVFGCDTVVAVDDEILGKPVDDDDAKRMLKLLSGRNHRVISGVCICYGDKKISFGCETKVKFHNLTDEAISQYIATSEHRDKAGAYGIQGYGSLLCEGIEGDFFNVVGFPVSEINKRLDFLLEG
ncbi:MAG: septum formation protein Maf [Ruminococcus sp.]|nr:septum formation protein Maf [Ruminococcus sp.]